MNAWMYGRTDERTNEWMNEGRIYKRTNQPVNKYEFDRIIAWSTRIYLIPRFYLITFLANHIAEISDLSEKLSLRLKPFQKLQPSLWE